MSDTENNAADTAKAETAEKPWTATLRNGNTYTFGGTKYERGVGVPVNEATKKALEERAVDHRIMGEEFDDDGSAVTEARAKFEFRKVGEDAAPARTRTRATR